MKTTIPQSAFLRAYDYLSPGHSAVRQNMSIYATVIFSRIAAAAWRGQQIDSFNEVREHALRDSIGFVFWFYAAEKIKRLFLRLAPADLRRDLLNVPGVSAESSPKGPVGRAFDFIFRSELPSHEGLQRRQAQLLDALKQTADKLGLDAGEQERAAAAVTKRFARLAKTMNICTFFSLMGAIALLGVTIPMLNILMTRRNMQKRQAATLAPAPTVSPFGAPPLSTSPLRTRPFAGVSAYQTRF